MEEKNDNLVKNPPLPSYKLAKLLHDCENEKKELASQVEDLKIQLQAARSHAESKETSGKLAGKLQAPRTEMDNLHLQINNIDRALQKAKEEPSSSQHRGNRRNQIMASGRRSSAKLSSEPQESFIKQLTESRDQLKEFLESRAHFEQEKLKEIQRILNDIKTLRELEDLKVAHKIEREKSLALQLELEKIREHVRQEKTFHAERALANLFLIRELRAVIDEQQNHVDERRPLLGTTEEGEALTPGDDSQEPPEQRPKAAARENGSTFDSQPSKLLPADAASCELPTKNKNPLTRKTLHRFLGWKKSKKEVTKPKSSGDGSSSLNVSH